MMYASYHMHKSNQLCDIVSQGIIPSPATAEEPSELHIR